jgi:hypothetical protein
MLEKVSALHDERIGIDTERARKIADIKSGVGMVNEGERSIIFFRND